VGSFLTANGTSAQLGYTVPFKLDVVKRYNSNLICNSIQKMLKANGMI